MKINLHLLPREEKFFRFFTAQADLITRACQLLVSEAESSNGVQRRYSAEIADIEAQGDRVVHEIFDRLNTTFITPIDPEDIHRLATSLDDVLDGIEDVAYRIHAYKPSSRHSRIAEICHLAAECASSIPEGVAKLATHQDVSDVCRRIGSLESSMDKVIRSAIADLMANETDPVEVIKMKEIFEYLEATADRCEDVADAFNDVVVKNA
jgi:predicted phosphate transport protein (TIGR00153 family)